MKKEGKKSVGSDILELLGIDISGVFEATIYIKANDDLKIDVKSFVKIDNEFVLNKDKNEIITELKKYHLIEIKEDK